MGAFQATFAEQKRKRDRRFEFPLLQRRVSTNRRSRSRFPNPAAGLFSISETCTSSLRIFCHANFSPENSIIPKFRPQSRCISQSTRRLIGCVGARLTPPSKNVKPFLFSIRNLKI